MLLNCIIVYRIIGAILTIYASLQYKVLYSRNLAPYFILAPKISLQIAMLCLQTGFRIQVWQPAHTNLLPAGYMLVKMHAQASGLPAGKIIFLVREEITKSGIISEPVRKGNYVFS